MGYAYQLRPDDIRDLALGAAVLGTGGGGDPYIGMLMALQALERGKKIEVVSLDHAGDNDLVIPVAGMGTPTVMIEKIPNGREALYALKLLESHYGKQVDYITPIEEGGINSTIPLVVAAERDKPVLDGDGMGRAFPELQMVTFHLVGVKATPMAMADEKGNAVLLDTVDNYWAEKIARVVTVRMGGTAWIAIYPMTGRKYREGAVNRSITYAIEIGRTLREAKKMGANPIDALLDITRGYLLFEGKIVDVARYNIGGFARGEARLEGLDSFRGKSMIVKFQNENLVALVNGEVVASVPDLIVILDKETVRPITTERLRYGLRVIVVGIPCDPKWRTPKGLETVGPRYFGYDIDYVPIEEKAGRKVM
ncbi:MAG: DUF917 domain-containing protein [Fervidicoccaceae archaeon]|jgi:DUF917 family protein